LQVNDLMKFHFQNCIFTDIDIEPKFDVAIRSNKWEGEDEEEDVKVWEFFFNTCIVWRKICKFPYDPAHNL